MHGLLKWTTVSSICLSLLVIDSQYLHNCIFSSDVNKDLTFKAKDKDQTLKTKDQDKDQTFKAKDQEKD